jgi:hypothetical protein
VLTFSGMHGNTRESDAGLEMAALPLTLPKELWQTLGPEAQTAYRRAEELLDAFSGENKLSVGELGARSNLSTESVLGGLEVLERSALVTIEGSHHGPLVTLIAVPEAHIPVRGPDGVVRWLFVARPLEPEHVSERELN